MVKYFGAALDIATFNVLKVLEYDVSEDFTIEMLKDATPGRMRQPGKQIEILTVKVCPPISCEPHKFFSKSVLLEKIPSLQEYIDMNGLGVPDDTKLCGLGEPNTLFLFILCNVETATRLPFVREEKSKTGVHLASSLARENNIRKMQDMVKSPSADARLDRLISTQRGDVPTAIYNGRPRTLTGESISIYHEIFQKFLSALSSPIDPSTLTPERLRCAAKVVKIGVDYHVDEKERRAQLEPVFSALLGTSAMQKIIKTSGTQDFIPDGSLEAHCTRLFKPGTHAYYAMLKLITEINNGLGVGGCDPNEQAQKDYQLVCINPVLEEICKNSCMPAFLLSMPGPYISVSGAVFIDGVITEPLTELISLVPLARHTQLPPGYTCNDDYHISRIAHIFNCLKSCLDDLDEYYANITPSTSGLGLQPAPFFQPFPERPLTYLSRFGLQRSPQSVFLAQDQSGIKYVVKFTAQYCKKAHELMVEKNAAPALHFCEWVPSVGLFVVVMDYLEEPEGQKLSNAGASILRQALEHLHAASYIHGDIRQPNIILDREGYPRVIDFDWSGKVNEARYATFVRQDEEFPAGVKGGKEITVEDDQWMMQKYISAQNGGDAIVS